MFLDTLTSFFCNSPISMSEMKLRTQKEMMNKRVTFSGLSRISGGGDRYVCSNGGMMISRGKPMIFLENECYEIRNKPLIYFLGYKPGSHQ
jgi:hypothetical protein